MLKKLNKKKLLGFCLLLAGTVLLIISIIKINNTAAVSGKTKSEEKLEVVLPEDTENKKATEAAFVKETCFDGSTELPYVLFDKPFGTSDEYKMNKDIIKDMDEETIKAYENTLRAVTEWKFNTSYRDILDNEDYFLEGLQQYFGGGNMISTNREEESCEYLADQLKQWYVDNEVVMESNFKTDKSLIWKDNGHTHIRGIVNVTLVNCKDTADMEDILGLSLKEVGETQSFIVEASFAGAGNTSELFTYSIIEP